MRPVEQEEGGAHSGPSLRYVNALAEAIEMTHPDKRITLACQYTEDPPARTRPRRNLRVPAPPDRRLRSAPLRAAPL